MWRFLIQDRTANAGTGVRPFIAGLACAAALFVSTGRAAAKVEFCPAVLGMMSRIGAPVGTPATAYVYELTALTPRSVDASLIADTSAGWFGWSVAGIELKRTTRFFRAAGLRVAYPVVASAPLAVIFPEPLIVRHAWVLVAEARGAAAFGKKPAAVFSCDVPAFYEASMDARSPTHPGALAPPSPLPAPSTPGARAAPVPAPFPPASCGKPFVPAHVTDPEKPELPTRWTLVGGAALVAVEVAVGKDGRLIDAWILGSSGQRPIDLSVLRAARSSTYSNPVSYCRPVNGVYLFVIFLRSTL